MACRIHIWAINIRIFREIQTVSRKIRNMKVVSKMSSRILLIRIVFASFRKIHYREKIWNFATKLAKFEFVAKTQSLYKSRIWWVQKYFIITEVNKSNIKWKFRLYIGNNIKRLAFNRKTNAIVARYAMWSKLFYEL